MREFVIWSFEHAQWWRPNQLGYTRALSEAGRYTAQEAGDIATASPGEEVALRLDVAQSNGPPTVSHLWAKEPAQASDERLRDVLRLLVYGLDSRDWSAVREAHDRLETARLAALREG